MGIPIEPKKSGWIGDKFTFLNVEFDLKKEEMSYEGKTISWKGSDVTDINNLNDVIF